MSAIKRVSWVWFGACESDGVGVGEWVHPQTARKWFREGNLPVSAQRVGPRSILVDVEANSAVTRVEGVGLYARVSSHDRKDDLARQTARLTGWAAAAGRGR